MDQSALVSTDKEVDEAILQNLERDGIHVAVAFWGRLEEYGSWRFFVASPDFDEMGRFQTYGRIAAARNADLVFNQHVITILSMEDPIVTGVRAFAGPKKQVQGVKLDGLSFGSRVIEEGILERVA